MRRPSCLRRLGAGVLSLVLVGVPLAVGAPQAAGAQQNTTAPATGAPAPLVPVVPAPGATTTTAPAAPAVTAPAITAPATTAPAPIAPVPSTAAPSTAAPALPAAKAGKLAADQEAIGDYTDAMRRNVGPLPFKMGPREEVVGVEYRGGPTVQVIVQAERDTWKPRSPEELEQFKKDQAVLHCTPEGARPLMDSAGLVFEFLFLDLSGNQVQTTSLSKADCPGG